MVASFRLGSFPSTIKYPSSSFDSLWNRDSGFRYSAQLDPKNWISFLSWYEY